LDDSVIFRERKWSELAPAIIESCVIAIVLVYSGKKVVNTLLWDLPKVKRFMALRRKGIGVKGDQRVF